ncbi:MAG: hypothetical protein KC457_23590, partial [Myxococcales bacterium]|nr:hypothetical protein [Myxococcales bacterium]
VPIPTLPLEGGQSCAHTVYAIAARHHRVEPYEADWVGRECQAVRVSLPRSIADAEPIDTCLGVVKSADHLIFSVDQVQDSYLSAFGVYRKIRRVDLITGARHLDIDRFSPISIFLAYEHTDSPQPCYYFLEAGSAQGNPEALYPAPAMGEPIHTQAGFSFTPFACSSNWYSGNLIMNSAGTEPIKVLNSVAQMKNGQRHYLELTADYAVQESIDRVNPPVLAQVEAVLRVCALAQGMGAEVVDKALQDVLAECARLLYPWKVQPPRSGKPDGYDGCP